MTAIAGQPLPPLAPQEPTRIETHGDVRLDEYFWLRNRDDPRVLAYLQAENEYTAGMMSHTTELQTQLYEEMRARLQEDDQTVPVQIDDFLYYERTEAGRQYPIYCRRSGSIDAPEEILLDLNRLAEESTYAAIGNICPSPNHRLLAYSFDDAGDETYTLFVKDLATGELLPERIPNTYYGLEWGADNQTLYYTVLDEAKRPYRIYRHRLGADPAQDELILSEPDIRFEVHLRKSKDNSLILIQVKSNTTSEEWFLPADQPAALPVVVEPRRTGVEYSVTRHLDRFFITTNDEALNFRVMVAPVATPGRPYWQDFIPHRTDVLIQATDAFREHLVIYEREGGLRHISVLDFTTGERHRIQLPEPVYALGRAPNPTFATTVVRFGYESLVTPKTVYDYEMATRTLHQRKVQIVRGYDPTAYETHRLWATAPDGAQVPISLVHRKGLVLDGQNPTVLYGYGAYGATWDAFFDARRISLLERGFVFALAHIRGGSDLGRAWYEAGKLLHKKNTFTDFIACAEHLIAHGYTSPQRLIILGRSAGGLLMGAVTNLRPDLFAGVVAGVPFVDVLSTMLDASIPLTAQEYEEWGDPADPEYYAYMRSYSPYDNVADRSYPQLLVTAGLNDPRVQYWEPAKWVARLRWMKNNPNRVLLKTNLAAGHSGASGRYDALHEMAFEYAFMLDVVGNSERRHSARQQVG
ncbi:MAG: oligopeptidase B [Chloroflexi bacterium]|nr:MAG: oligopeptidase B [Chloroflexota bacterium]